MNEINRKRKIIRQMQKTGMTVAAADLEEVERADDKKYVSDFCEHIPNAMRQELVRIKHPIRIVIDVLPQEEKIRVGSCEVKEDDRIQTLIPIGKSKYKKVLQICTPEGELWEDRYSFRTFLRFIETVGEEKVASLNLVTSYGMLMSKEKQVNSQVSRQETSTGWQVMTSIATAEKVRIVNEISELLKLDYDASIVPFPVAE